MVPDFMGRLGEPPLTHARDPGPRRLVVSSVPTRRNPMHSSAGKFIKAILSAPGLRKNKPYLELRKSIKELLFTPPLRSHFFPNYSYQFTPAQLCFLCQCIEDTRNIEGAVAEVGCAIGDTTVFLNKYLDDRNIEKHYFAIDTFSGFVADDIRFEVTNRGKTEDLYNGFRVNKKKWFDGTMRQNDVTRVRSIEADVNEYDLTKLGPLSFSLLDVDLYRPVKKGLGDLYEVLRPGGIIVVDDCDSSNIRWNGADQAYKEFMQEINRPVHIVHNKLGVINKPLP
jgi:SAM-dependent methyltransferase